MLDRFKLFQELERVREQIFATSDEHLQDLEQIWKQICTDETVISKLKGRKWSLLIPFWQGEIGRFFPIKEQIHPYQVLAVDGSQIYYDKHQGPACSLVNIGAVFLHYGIEHSRVELYSYPEIMVVGHNQIDFIGTEYINLYREQSELTVSVKKSCQYTEKSNDPFLCMLDGSLIFFQLDSESKSDTNDFFMHYIKQLQLFFENKILHVAYMSFPKTKDLINVVRLFAVDYQEKNLQANDYLTKFLDMDVLKLFLPQGHRTIVFESKAPICYAYPKHLKPYFCYLNVGEEIVRLEFPQWIMQDSDLIDHICAIALDQAQKGHGYPVALFEAHEQAVVKSSDREFFYNTIKQMYIKNNQQYIISAKSSKKIQPIV
jgi:hypothetical protein